MTAKIFRSILGAALAVLLLSFMVVTVVLYGNFVEVGRRQLRDELELAVRGTERAGDDYLASLGNRNYRFTWVDAAGMVLYDSDFSSGLLGNHLDREEIVEALETGRGDSSRYSDTLTKKMYYEACQLDDGSVLRVAASIDSVFSLLSDVLWPMMGVLFLALVLSALLARSMARKIVKPLNRLNLDKPEENDVYDELSPMLWRLGRQHQQIEQQIQELRRRAEEFEQITASMSEGLLLLDGKGHVLSINPAASRVFALEKSAVGRNFPAVEQSAEMRQAVESALSGEHREFRMQRNGLEYQIDISPIKNEGVCTGAVILCFDVTETAFAERNRREFTANVSHELKTPLQSIMGCAELLESGMVKPEDTARFLGNIRTEASRLLSLINDIIRLSQMDENSAVMEETVDLLSVAEEAVESLKDTASRRDVRVQLEGENCVMRGVRRYLYEIIFNLCDNAIRYNKDGGSVKVKVGVVDGRPTISVEDTGIGIPQEHQSRIFERFYRVDKSHSRSTGGTGLGLSIVKHAAAYHNGSIQLESECGRGTTIRVSFEGREA